MEVLWRGAFGMDAKRGAMGQGLPTVTTLGAAPERGESGVARPGCRARFLFGYFLFCASKEKVTRRGAKPVSSVNESAAVNRGLSPIFPLGYLLF